MLGKEVDVVGTMFEGISDAVFYEFLGEVHIVLNLVERHFRLNHPELRKVAGRVGVFGAESRPERVDASEGRCSELAFELA